VAYAGHDTQAWLSLPQVKAKISNLQVNLNCCVKGLVIALVIFCFYCAIMAQVQNDKMASDFIEDFCTYWVILYQIVPIGLYVGFEVMKLVLGFQINFDKSMVDEKTKQAAMARTADLVEEMGQVRYVFSDKTGTLTQNEMRFARCFIGNKDFGEFRLDVAMRQMRGASKCCTPGTFSSSSGTSLGEVTPEDAVGLTSSKSAAWVPELGSVQSG